MDFVFAWALGAFDAAERTASVGGFIVKTDVGIDAGEAERGFSLELGAGFSLSACVYIFRLLLGVLANRAVRMGAAFFDSRSGGALVWGTIPCHLLCAQTKHF